MTVYKTEKDKILKEEENSTEQTLQMMVVETADSCSLQTSEAANVNVKHEYLERTNSEVLYANLALNVLILWGP